MQKLELVGFRSPALAADLDVKFSGSADPEVLRGKRIGFRVEWPSFRVFCEELDRYFSEHYGTTDETAWWDVTSEDDNPWVGTTAETAAGLRTEEMATRMTSCDVGVFGLAACGSCTEASVADFAVAFKRGLPSLVVATQTFIDLSKIRAMALGISPLPMVVVPHPFETLDRDVIRQIARDKAPEIAAILSGQLSANERVSLVSTGA